VLSTNISLSSGVSNQSTITRDTDNLSTTIQTVTTPSALLDLVFLPWSGYEHIFVTATSTSTLSLYTLTPDPAPKINHIYTHQCTDTSILLTDVEAHPDVRGLIGYVTSSGLVSIIEFNLDVLITNNETGQDIPTHDLVRYHHSSPCADDGFEAWTLAFAPPSAPGSPDGEARTVIGVYTGSDDSTLRRLDFALGPDAASSARSSLQGATERDEDDSDDDDDDDDDDEDDDDKAQSATLQILDRRSHDAGVVAILPLLPHPHSRSGEYLLTGSYDDRLRVLCRPSGAATPAVRNSVLAETNLDGGVWRLKLISSSSSDAQDGASRSWTVLASCMHAGARVVRITQTVGEEEGVGQWTVVVLARFEEHASMNYGSDVQPVVLPSQDESEGVGQREGMSGAMVKGTRTVVSTSFYDRRMCLWRIDC